jgi:hypothetical protein
MADTGKPQQHTPGPWRREGDHIVGQRYVCELSDWAIVAAGSSYPEINAALTAERDANAALIAAAPELLAALVAVLPFAECEEEQRVYLMSAGDDEWAETMVRPVAQALAAARAALRLATLPAEGGAP